MRSCGALSSYATFLSLAIIPLLAQPSEAVPPRITQSIDETQLVTLKGNRHPLARPQYDQGTAPAELPMERVLLLLRRGPEQESELQQLLEEQQDLRSVNYHQWLTPEQFGEQFGPAPEDIDKITSWLGFQGFVVDRIANGRGVVEFSGSAAQVERAFHTPIHRYLWNGKQYWANARDPQIPAALAPVVAGIVSLNNFPEKKMHSAGSVFREDPDGAWIPATPEVNTSSNGTTYHQVGPYDFAIIYNVLPLWNTAIDGTGQTIAIVATSNINLQDVRNFRSLFGLPARNPIVTVNGPDPGTSDIDLEGEAVSDTEWTGAVAKGATINLVVSESTTTTDGSVLSSQYIVDNNVGGILSSSYGLCELSLASENQFYNSLWQQAAAEGITVVVAAGDGGSGMCEESDTDVQSGLQVNGIASTPYDIAVGGTDFSDVLNQTTSQYWSSSNNSTTLASAESYIPEMTWNDSCASPQIVSFFGPKLGSSSPEALCNNPQKQMQVLTVTAGAGGPSSLYSKPSWQSGVPGIPVDGWRDLPDLSLFAGDETWEHAYIFCQADYGTPCISSGSSGNTVGLMGGTSLSTAAFAGVMALVDQKSGSRQGLANPALYKLASTQYASVFHDVTVGTNDVPCLKGTPNCYVSQASDTYGLLSTSTSSYIAAYPAGPGYDLATGLGSIDVANMVNNWPSRQSPALTITTSSPLPSGTVGVAYSETLAASGGNPPYSWSMTVGALPNGLTLSSSGMIAGTPTAAGTANFTVQVSDSSAETASASFSLTIATANSSQPVINPGGVISIAGPVPWPGLTPMGWVSIYGNNLSNTTRSWTAADFNGNNLPTKIDGVTVSIDGKPGYISYVSPHMLNLQVPDDSRTGMVPVTVTNNGLTSAPVMVNMTPCAPAFKTFGQYVAALHADGSVVAPAGMFPGSTPAAPGEEISVWGVGWGPTNPPRSAGQLVDAAPLANPSELSITIGSDAVAVPYAALAAGAGLYQFNVVVPPNLGSGNWPVAGSMWGYDTQTGVSLSVKQEAAPVIASLAPSSGTVGQTLTLTIKGSNLTGVTAVNFSPSAGISVTNVTATSSSVTATVAIAASAAQGKYRVTVSGPGGTSNASTFLVGGPFDGSYQGTSTVSGGQCGGSPMAPSTNSLYFTVANSQVTVVVDGGVQDTSVTGTITADGTAQGFGAAFPEYNVTFAGQFVINGSGASASGTWSATLTNCNGYGANGSDNGTWSATRE